MSIECLLTGAAVLVAGCIATVLIPGIFRGPQTTSCSAPACAGQPCNGTSAQLGTAAQPKVARDLLNELAAAQSELALLKHSLAFGSHCQATMALPVSMRQPGPGEPYLPYIWAADSELLVELLSNTAGLGPQIVHAINNHAALKELLLEARTKVPVEVVEWHRRADVVLGGLA